MSDTIIKGRTGGAIGVTYEGGDPDLLERILPLADYIEVTLESVTKYVAELHN